MENQNKIEEQMDIEELIVDDSQYKEEEYKRMKENNAQLIQQVSDLQFKLTNAESEIASLNEQLHKQQEMFLIKLGKMAYNMFD
jgi:FtsZ-binding cell division protein ZapB